MVEGLVLSFIGYWILGCVIKAGIERWDESRCRSTWEFNRQIHLQRLQEPNHWRAYHRWRVRTLTGKLQRYQAEIAQLIEAQKSTPPLVPPPANTESSRPY